VLRDVLFSFIEPTITARGKSVLAHSGAMITLAEDLSMYCLSPWDLQTAEDPVPVTGGRMVTKWYTRKGYVNLYDAVRMLILQLMSDGLLPEAPSMKRGRGFRSMSFEDRR
jgi:hypothetical protein